MICFLVRSKSVLVQPSNGTFVKLTYADSAHSSHLLVAAGLVVPYETRPISLLYLTDGSVQAGLTKPNWFYKSGMEVEVKPPSRGKTHPLL